MNGILQSTVDKARKEGYIRGLRTSAGEIALIRSRERKKQREARKASDLDIRMDTEYSLEVLKSLADSLRIKIKEAKNVRSK